MVQLLLASAGLTPRHSQAVDGASLVLSLYRTRGGQAQWGPGWEPHALQAKVRVGVEREWGEGGLWWEPDGLGIQFRNQMEEATEREPDQGLAQHLGVN